MDSIRKFLAADPDRIGIVVLVCTLVLALLLLPFILQFTDGDFFFSTLLFVIAAAVISGPVDAVISHIDI